MWGILALDRGFELLCGGLAIGGRRHLDASTVSALTGFSERYIALLASSQPAAGLLALGRELYGWLDGDGGRLTEMLQRADRPLRFEVCTANRFPEEAEWALLRAPWELLADGNGFLAGDVGLGFSPVRRLGRRVDAPQLDKHRLGLVFMAASPHGGQELDYEAEETAIMAAVGSTKLDLLVEESGNPDELGDRLTEYASMQTLHLSCHGHNAWPSPGNADDKPKPVLLLETPEGEALPTDADQLIRALRAYRPRFVFLSACLTAAAGGEKRNGLLAEDSEVVESCATDAIIALRQGPAAAATALGRAAIDLLDTLRRAAPWRLLSETAAAAATGGDGVTADTLLERGVAALDEQRQSGATIDPAAALFLVYEQARRLMTRGELDQAQGLFAEAARFAEAAGKEISATIARGAIADILRHRGDLDAALRIRQEEELPVFERLGEVRSRALTMGGIADILESRGDLDAALRIRQEEELPVYERLGDVRSRAVTMGQIAQILLQKGDATAARILQQERLEINRRLADADGIGATLWSLALLDLTEQRFNDAVPRVIEAYGIMSDLGRADFIAVIGMSLGTILAANDKPEDARHVLQRSAEMFVKLGHEDDAKQADDLIRQLGLE